MKILIISHYFAPDNAIAAVRPSKLAKYFVKENNQEVSLLTTSQNVDSQYLSETIKVSIVKSRLRKLLDKILTKRRNTSNKEMKDNNAQVSCNKSKLKSYIYEVAHYVLRQLSFLAELGSAKKQYRYFKKHIYNHTDFTKYQVIISTFSPLYTHYMAKCIKNENNIWIADFRDPLYVDGVSSVFKIYCEKTIKKIVNSADAITVVGKDGIEKYQLPANLNVHVVPNGFDKDDFKDILCEKDDNFNISYTGTFYYKKSSLLRIYQAISNLIKEGKIDKSKVRIHYAGKQGNYCRKWAVETNLLDVFINHGYIDKKECLTIQRKSDMVLVTAWNTKRNKGILTGKIYELLLSGAPIVAEITGDVKDSEIKKTITETNTGFCYEEAEKKGDVKELQEYIYNCYVSKMSGGNKTFYAPNIDEIKKYDYKNIARQMMDIINNCKR